MNTLVLIVCNIDLNAAMFFSDNMHSTNTFSIDVKALRFIGGGATIDSAGGGVDDVMVYNQKFLHYAPTYHSKSNSKISDWFNEIYTSVIDPLRLL